MRNILCFLSVVAFSYNKDGYVARNSCVYLLFRVFYFLFFRFLLFISELFRFKSNKRFQILFNVFVFDSVFKSRIFSAINNNFFSDFSVSDCRAFQFSFIHQMSVLFFCLLLAVLYFVNFTSRVGIIRNNYIKFTDGNLAISF